MGLVAPRYVGSSWTRARTCVPSIGRQILNHCATREALSHVFKQQVHHLFYSPRSLSFPWGRKPEGGGGRGEPGKSTYGILVWERDDGGLDYGLWSGDREGEFERDFGGRILTLKCKGLVFPSLQKNLAASAASHHVFFSLYNSFHFYYPCC